MREQTKKNRKSKTGKKRLQKNNNNVGEKMKR